MRRTLDEAEDESLVCIELRTRRLALLARLAIAAIPVPGRRNPDLEAPFSLPRRTRSSIAAILPNEKKTSATAFIERTLVFCSQHSVPVERIMTHNGSA
ncbi:hypothetical protein RB623_26190 [Mesorhizobium sp. LHD-90]|uniref:hypothetical protein n=1 Tax=Mesorhizobium sp. LHD-90 TaxID=3071414 RepID=UPI0027E16AAB|nr:hypothetical protein [Mesorhizobium sp. LHD-90]MDQ6437559.1 hypothetical protein [Mesorhizobium sp. LHD-90]